MCDSLLVLSVGGVSLGSSSSSNLTPVPENKPPPFSSSSDTPNMSCDWSRDEGAMSCDTLLDDR